MTAPEKVNILMVDDQPGKLLSYEAILGELGENLIKASSGTEALEILLKTDVAIVLMDVSMPELDGLELATMIRQHPRFQQTAIIFISAVRLTDMDRLAGYQRGAVDYISVPVVPELLRAKVSIFAELYRKTRELEKLNKELEQRVAERSEELRNVNGQLQQRVTELETIMQVLPVGVAVAHDSACAIVTANAALSELHGLKPGDNLSKSAEEGGRLPYDVYENGELIPVDRMPLQRAVTTGRPTGSVEIEVRTRNGKSANLVGTASPLLDDAGNVRGGVGAFYDVTARKQMEDTLRERAELLELASEAILVCNLDGTITFWNRGAESIFGWTRQEALGQTAENLLGAAPPHLSSQDPRAIAAHDRQWKGELIRFTKTSEEIIVSSHRALQLDEKGRPKAFLEVNRDITEQKRTEAALRISEKAAALGRLAGTIAHEINNPIEAVKNAFYLLKGHKSLDHEARTLATMAEREINRISHITKQTLSFYRESQRPTEVALSEVINDVLGVHSRKIQLENISLRREFQGDGRILGFPGELRQAILNLVGNAIEAMPGGGSLTVRLHPSIDPRNGGRRGVRVSIFDTGSGIRPDDKNRLFEPFFSTKEMRGTGLGLWVTQGIVQKHEGAIRFRSCAFSSGKVTCFSIFVPSSGLPATAKTDVPITPMAV
jgi:PAS domain S-box-containing protein